MYSLNNGHCLVWLLVVPALNNNSIVCHVVVDCYHLEHTSTHLWQQCDIAASRIVQLQVPGQVASMEEMFSTVPWRIRPWQWWPAETSFHSPPLHGRISSGYPDIVRQLGRWLQKFWVSYCQICQIFQDTQERQLLFATGRWEADEFITSLYLLVKNCDHGAMQDLMMHDCIVVAIRGQAIMVWRDGCTVVPKPSGAVWICVDYGQWKESVLSEVHPLPKVDATLAQLAGVGPPSSARWMPRVVIGKSRYQKNRIALWLYWHQGERSLLPMCPSRWVRQNTDTNKSSSCNYLFAEQEALQSCTRFGTCFLTRRVARDMVKQPKCKQRTNEGVLTSSLTLITCSSWNGN